MNEYITRKSETYARACQGLFRVMKTHGSSNVGSTSTSSRWSTSNDPWSRYQAYSQANNSRGDDDDKGNFDALVSDPDLTEEGQALLMSAEEEVQQPLVQLEHHRTIGAR